MVLLVAATAAELCGHDGLVCGVGPVEAAAATAFALARQPAIGVLHVGLAGGPNPVSLVIGSRAAYVDLLAEWPVVDRVDPDTRLVDAARLALPSARLAPILTSATVGASRNRADGPIEAMEGFAVLRAAQLAGIPAVEVRAISNVVGEADRAAWRVEEALERLGQALPGLLSAVTTVLESREGRGVPLVG